MPRTNVKNPQLQQTHDDGNAPVFRGERSFGDGLSGEIVAARLQGFYVDGVDYRDVQVDVDGKLVTTAAGGGGGGPATIADGADVAQGATTDAAVITDAAGTVSGKLRGLVKWAYERMPASLGQKVKTASFPVVIASDQDALAVTGPLTDGQLRATPVPVSGTVSVTEPVSIDDNGSSITVDGTVTATGPLTDAQLRAAAVPIDSELPAAAALADNMANPTAPAVAAHAMVWDGAAWDRTAQPLTDTQLRASAVPVSGPLTDAQLRATPVPVSGTVSVTEPVSVDDNGGSLTVDGSISLAAAIPAGGNNIGDVDVASQAFGKTITRFVIAQGAAGTTVIAAAVAGQKHKVVAYDFTLSADGTAKLIDGAGDLTGAYDIAQRGGKVNPAAAGGAFLPWVETAVNSALSIVTTGGAARGVILFVTEA